MVLRGENIKKFLKNDYLAQFDTVFQKHNSYAFTFTKNIAFESNLSDSKTNKMKEVFDSLVFNEFIPLINKEINLTKEFLEDSLMFSGGQIQKIALTRALYRNNPILILGEPTSALDPISEHKLMRSLKQVIKDRTVLLISHRLSSVRDADCIYFILMK